MARSIPDRWIPYKPCGEVIEGTRIICFKVPLKLTVQKANKIKVIWDIATLLSKIPGLGAVIDLTNTARYYDPQEFKAAGVQHKKILMPGRVIPPDNKVFEFMDVVDTFLQKPGKLIGVHCTHGLNRTGYMVCRYMRDRLGIHPAEAIARFEKARGYKIERENYIADILGKKPPPPDIGKETKILSIQDSTESKSWRTPRNGLTDEKSERRNDRERRKKTPQDSDWRKRDRESTRSKSPKRADFSNFGSSRTRKTSSTQPYDYRFDY